MYAFRVGSDDPAEDDFVNWLAAGLDRKRGKTQAGLAVALGVAQPRISEILHGKRRLQVAEIAKIAKYIERSPPSKWLKIDPLQSDSPPDTSAKSRGEIRFALHANPALVWVLIFRDEKLVDQFEADADYLDNLRRQVSRAIQSLPKPK
jgi:transcriptional regulator with XRE-family HTH domain